MPRSPTSPFAYAVPAGTTAIPNTTITVDQHNNFVNDVAATFNTVQPILYGGTGASTKAGAQANLGIASVSQINYIATGGTANVQTLTPADQLLTLTNGISYNIIITTAPTGAATMNVSSTGAKAIRMISAGTDVDIAAGSMLAAGRYTIEYSTTAASGAGAWIVTNPSPLIGALTNLTSATTTDLGTIGSHNVNITGTTTITGFGSSAAIGQPIYNLTFAGVLHLTYNATSLITPGAIDYFTQAGDTCQAIYLGSGNWQVINYTRKSVPVFSATGISGGSRNLVLTVTGNTTGTITADGATLFDANGNAYYASAVSLTNTNSGAGANGLDTGALATSTWYAVLIIYNPTTNTVACLISLSATAPTMPSGYTFKLRVGWWRNAASGGYWRTIQYGRRATITLGTNPSTVPIIDSGSTSSAWKSEAVANFVPSTAAEINVIVGGGGGVSLTGAAPNNSYSTSGSSTNPSPLWNNSNSTAPTSGTITALMVLESANIFYIANAGGGSIATNGWVDNL